MNYYIDNEIIMQRKVGPMVYVYIMVIVILFLSLIIFFILFSYKTYYRAKGIVVKENDNYYIRLYVPLDDVKYITKNDIVYINKEKFKYNIISIDEEYFTDNVITYQVINISIDMVSKYKFNNLNLSLSFIKENKRVIDYFIKGGNDERNK